MTEKEPAVAAGTAGAPGPGRTGNAVARRGDLVVICLRHRDWKAGQPREHDEFWLGQVTSVTRAGLVRLYRPAGQFAWEADGRGRPCRGRPLPSLWFERAAIKSQAEIDVPGALATAACHVWPGHEDHVRGYPTLTEVRAALRPHLLESAGREQLRDAAAAWEAARREGRPAAERGGPRPRRGVPPPVGSLRRRRSRREQRLPRAARAGGRDRERGGMTGPAPESVTETWIYGGIRADKDGRKWHAWVDAAGEEHWFARTGGGRMAVGSCYTAQVTRRDGGISLRGTPEYAGSQAGQETRAALQTAHTLAQTRIEALRAERDAARRSALDEAIAPLLELAAPLRTGAQRDALAAYVIRKLHSTWTTRKPPGSRQ